MTQGETERGDLCDLGKGDKNAEGLIMKTGRQEAAGV